MDKIRNEYISGTAQLPFLYVMRNITERSGICAEAEEFNIRKNWVVSKMDHWKLWNLHEKGKKKHVQKLGSGWIKKKKAGKGRGPAEDHKMT